MTPKLPDDQWPLVTTTRRLDIGVASYKNAEKLDRTLRSIEQQSTTDWRCLIVHNPSDGDEDVREVIASARLRNGRFASINMPKNVGYARAVNRIMQLAKTEYIAYLDNDVEILTSGWDESFARLLDDNPECAQVFPGAGHYGFHNGRYHECLWNAGYAWMIRRAAVEAMTYHDAAYALMSIQYSPMDTTLGHHEEVDLMIRLRMAGYQIGCVPDINILHHESSTRSPESAKRIHAGVVRWMNKWNRIFYGDVFKYPNPDPDSGEGYDPRMLRYTDWPPCALYLERFTLANFPSWNKAPRSVRIPGVGEMDAIEILKPKGCYVGRAI